jgi:ubiquinone/menaquinone biosynthesis C-methylase UbiE
LRGPTDGEAMIDWNQLWKQNQRQGNKFGQREYWNKRAPSFSKQAAEGGYSKPFMQIVKPQPEWSVLDVGSGGGTVSVPLAHVVREVTALDFSPAMLKVLEERCREEKLTNVRTVEAGWEDDWILRGVKPHDVAVASRSLVVDDLRTAIQKLNRFARKRVYITASVGDGPRDRGLIEAVGREFKASPDYIYPYNVLHEMGIYANVEFIVNRINKPFATREEAYEAIAWMVDEMTPAEEKKARAYVESHLVNEGEVVPMWRMDYDRVVRWAVMWWDRTD